MQKPESPLAFRETPLHVTRSHEDLKRCDVHSHVGRVPRHESTHKGKPNQVEYRSCYHRERAQFGSPSTTGQSTQKAEERALLHHWEDNVAKIAEHGIVETCYDDEQRKDETIESSLVAQANAVVNPRTMVVKAVHTATTFLAMVGTHSPPCSAYDAYLLEVAFVEQRQVLATALRQNPLHSSTADLLTSCSLALPQYQRCSFQLLSRMAIHQRLQLSLAGPSGHGTIYATHTRTLRVLSESPLRLGDELPLVVEFVLFHFHACKIAFCAGRRKLQRQAVVVSHL
mmetsp:Transcript_122437/g.305671  ORF Transcript_122437/g.305671 Transcript_122437/m.305671 type:complete len:285 (-) Transcript_122437:1096-1950(-)